VKTRKNSHTTFEHVEDLKRKAEDFMRRLGNDDAADKIEDESVEDYADRKGFIIENPDRPSAALRGYGHAWRKKRLEVLARDKKCRDPHKIGCKKKSRQVDHKIPKSQGGTDDMKNLQGTCDSCHSRKTATQDGGFGRPKKTRRRLRNGLFSQEEKKAVKRKLKRKVKHTARRGLLSLFSAGKRKATSSGRRTSSAGTSLPGIRADVASALVNQGFSKSQARAAAAQTSGSSFNEIFSKAVASRRRNPQKRNPADTELTKAAAMFRKFHGANPNKVVEIQEEIQGSGKYAQLGMLLQLDMYQGPELNCRQAGIRLCCDPDGQQLFLLGGSQDIEAGLKPMFGITSEAQLVDLGEINKIWYLARKSMHQFEPIEYHHRFGEEGGSRPRLMYDRRHKKMFIVGGDYEIKAVGIKN